MRFGMRPYLMAGVGIVAAGSIAIPPSVAPPGHTVRHESVALAAHVQPVNPLLQQVPEYATAQAAAALLPPEALTSTAALTETLDAASAQVSALALPGLGNAIIAAYDVIMPWVDWAVNLGIYATQWIPIVNWFTPQISIVYYSLIEPIITSAVFNTAYWVGGAISFGQGLANFFNDTVNAGIGFVNAEIDWFLGFLPPLPPFIPLAAQATMDIVGARTAMQVAAPTAVGESDPAAVDTDETESGEPAAPLPEETETAPVDEVEAEPTTPEAPVDSEPQDENASDLDPRTNSTRSMKTSPKTSTRTSMTSRTPPRTSPTRRMTPRTISRPTPKTTRKTTPRATPTRMLRRSPARARAARRTPSRTVSPVPASEPNQMPAARTDRRVTFQGLTH